MKSIIFRIIPILALSFFSCSQHSEINTGTLLLEMINRETISEFPNPTYTTKQFSSYDRKSISPDKPDWFANSDRSQFIGIEDNEGRREFVMFDSDGPGAIVRFWATVANYKGNGILRIYIDEKEEPVIEGEVFSLISGNGIVEGPLASSVSELTDYIQRGHNLYLPIPYNKHCKITYESDELTEKPGAETGEAFYYNINYRSYANDASVRSFNKNDLVEFAAELQDVRKALEGRHIDIDRTHEIHKKDGTRLKPNQSVSLKLEGRKAIKQLSVGLSAKKNEQALRSTVLEIQFDNQRTVWCPVGDFFGTGYKLSPFKTWYTEVLENGVMTSKWVMPFSENAEVILHNLGDQEVTVKNFEVGTSAYDWTGQTMHFGAGWFEQHRLKSQLDGKNSLGEEHGHFDMNYVTLSGKGVLVGNGVTLFNTIDAWWGEGDEKIYVDNESFPSHFGTGTEDFYGYAWSKPEKFQHPFIAQPDGEGAISPGHVVNLRYRSLDAIPFEKKLRVDMEMWHWLKTPINHAPISYWYMLPGGSSNIEPAPLEAKKPVALSRMDFFLEGYLNRNIFLGDVEVNIQGQENGYEIRYTLDGTEPTKSSSLYKETFKLTKTTTVKSIGFLPNGYSTEVLEGKFIKQTPLKSVPLSSLTSGLSYTYIEPGEILDRADQLYSYETKSSGSIVEIGFPKIELAPIFGLVLEGYIKVPTKGIYTFSTNTNDGSMLYVHDELIVNNDGGHAARERFGQVALEPGFHPIRLEYFQIGGGKLLEVSLEGPKIKKHKLTPQELFH